MLRIRRLRIEIKTNDGLFGIDKTFSDGLNFIASNDNTSGKSSIIASIYYCLGFEQIIGGSAGRGEHVLTAAYKSEIDVSGKLHAVLESGAYLEISNGEEIVTLYRSAKMENRNSKLVTVYYGTYETIGSQKALPDDMYLHDGGAATNTLGFHNYLESFLHLELPIVPTSDDSERKLYLQTIFSCLFIEQKHGWSDIFSGMPVLGIKDAKRRIVEFLLGFDTFKNERERETLKSLKTSITAKWEAISNEVHRVANRESCSIINLPNAPRLLTDHDIATIQILSVNGETIDVIKAQLVKEYKSLKLLKPRNVDNFDSLNSELQELQRTNDELEEAIRKYERQLALEKHSSQQFNLDLEIINSDLRNNKDAAKIRKLGSNLGSKIAEDICPVCKQHIQDTLIISSSSVQVMSIDENIHHLESQKQMLEFSLNGCKSRIEQLNAQINDGQSRLITIRRLAQTIRSDIYHTETELSESVFKKRFECERQIDAIEQLLTFMEQQKTILGQYSSEWQTYLSASKKLPKKAFSDRDIQVLRLLKTNFIEYLQLFNYKSINNMETIDIPLETCLPTIDGFDMKFDSSASDNIRVIWAFTLALLKTSISSKGNHPNVLIFDEPAQHSIVTADMEHFIKSAIALSSESQIIVGVTVKDSDLRNVITNIDKKDYSMFFIENRAFQKLLP